MTERDELIELIREALNANGYVVDRGYVAMADIRDAADAVLAGGWRKVEPTCDHHYVRALPSVAYCDRCGRQRFAAEDEDLPLPPTPEETMQMMLDQIARESG
jgi:hypothetical protein